jgi:hypothetical protein
MKHDLPSVLVAGPDTSEGDEPSRAVARIFKTGGSALNLRKSAGSNRLEFLKSTARTARIFEVHGSNGLNFWRCASCFFQNAKIAHKNIESKHERV